MFGGIPFDHFGGMGGHGMPGGGGGGRGRRGPAADVDTTKLYETLEIEKGADAKEIKKAYRKLSRVHHPDKGGDEHKFKEINAAYEILSDEDQRKLYDKHGLDGVSDQNGGSGRGGGGGGEDLFSMFFGGGGRSSQGPRKGPSVNHPLKVSLEDLYNGKTVKLAVNRKVIVGDVKECDACNGQGAVMEMRQIGPGMITQSQRPCSTCAGKGNNAKTKNERKVLEVHVDKGMKHNQKISFSQMADEQPNMEPGDINFIVQEKDHTLFKRKEADLLVTKDLSLNQALCGFSWKFTHLDGREIVVKTQPGEIIRTELKTSEGKTLPFIKMIKDEGMPSHGNPFVKGNLYMLFHVRFPEDGELSADVVEILKRALSEPDVPEAYDPMEVEEVHMDVAELEHFGKGGAMSHAGANDSDEEGGEQPVQCQQS